MFPEIYAKFTSKSLVAANLFSFLGYTAFYLFTLLVKNSFLSYYTHKRKNKIYKSFHSDKTHDLFEDKLRTSCGALFYEEHQ